MYLEIMLMMLPPFTGWLISAMVMVPSTIRKAMCAMIMRNMAGLSNAIEVVASKRRVQVPCCLVAGQKRFNEIKRGCADVSSAELSRVMGFLSQRGIVVRRESIGKGNRVEYRLTDRGEHFASVLEAMERWGNRL